MPEAVTAAPFASKPTSISAKAPTNAIARSARRPAPGSRLSAPIAFAGADAQTEYQWAPAGRPGPNLHYRFCKTCAARTAGKGENGPKGGTFYFIAVASLDNADPDELATSVRYVDGRHDRYDRRPDDTRLM